MNSISMSGALSYQVGRVQKAPLSWTLQNALRWGYIWGWVTTTFAKIFSRITGIVTMTTELRAKLYKDGEVIDYGVLGRRVVTTAGVGFLVDAWQNSVELEAMKYHSSGYGTGAEAVGDTALGNEINLAGASSDATRPYGAPALPAANIVSLAATISYDDTVAVTEHGIFSSATYAAGVLWDRTKFTAINVVNGNTIAFTYQVTFNAGG